MSDNNQIVPIENLKDKIFTIRGMQVMLDHDLAELFGVETKSFNRAVKRNVERFPELFRFQLTKSEYENLRFQFGTSSRVSQNAISNEPSGFRSEMMAARRHGGRRYLTYAFTSCLNNFKPQRAQSSQREIQNKLAGVQYE